MAAWFRFKSKNEQKDNFYRHGRVALSFCKEGIALAHCLYEKGGIPDLQFCEFYPYDQHTKGNEAAWLARIIQSRELNGVACSWVLLPEDYKFLMLEAPDVPVGKTNTAVRWQLKEVIDFPLEDALIDTCLMPEFGHLNRQMLHTVVAQESRLAPHKKNLQAAGTTLTAIDITELALHNLSNLFSGGGDSIVVVWLSPDCSLLTVSYNKNLYFSRRFSIEITSLSDEYCLKYCKGDEVPEAFGTLVLTIEQSLEYFESQMIQPMPRSVVMTPLSFRSTRLKGYLNEKLAQEVILADLNTVLKTQQELTLEVQAQCIPVLGGLLRMDEVSYVAAD
ncbi:MAG: biosis protein MshI [Gammaproteobacteria bacterium]|nr:biosis protein MshI [Gammaproteobacteria bacterium]